MEERGGHVCDRDVGGGDAGVVGEGALRESDGVDRSTVLRIFHRHKTVVDLVVVTIVVKKKVEGTVRPRSFGNDEQKRVKSRRSSRSRRRKSFKDFAFSSSILTLHSRSASLCFFFLPLLTAFEAEKEQASPPTLIYISLSLSLSRDARLCSQGPRCCCWLLDGKHQPATLCFFSSFRCRFRCFCRLPPSARLHCSLRATRFALPLQARRFRSEALLWAWAQAHQGRGRQQQRR